MIHSLDTLAGYIVVKTIEDGARIADRDVAVFTGAGHYVDALDAARALRAQAGAWAVVYPVYADGQRGESPF